jgi:hypothetical protein
LSDERLEIHARGRRQLKKIHREAIKRAKQQPAPPIVIAYQNVYGTFPYGWPPREFDDRDE